MNIQALWTCAKGTTFKFYLHLWSLSTVLSGLAITVTVNRKRKTRKVKGAKKIMVKSASLYALKCWGNRDEFKTAVPSTRRWALDASAPNLSRDAGVAELRHLFSVDLRPAEVSRSRSRIWARWIASFSASLWPEHCMWRQLCVCVFSLGHARATRKERLWLIGPGNVRWNWANWVIKWQPSHILFFFLSFLFLFSEIH
jgi:hypothetical protein